MYWLSVGCEGGAEIAVEIREKRSGPKVGSGTKKLRQLGGVSKTLSRVSLFLAGAVAAF